MMPVCVKCQLFFKPAKNNVVWEEGKPGATGEEPYSEGGWSSYKLWRGDLLRCEGCGTEIISGHARERFAEHYQDNYSEIRNAFPPHTFVKDCC